MARKPPIAPRVAAVAATTRDLPATPRTRTLDWPAATMVERGVISQLRFAGRALPPLELAPTRATFAIGRKSGDLIVPATIGVGVSALHARLTRTGTGLRVIDAESKNGVFASAQSPRVPSLEVQAGGRFWLADVELLATDAWLERLRPVLALALGVDDYRAVDQALTAASVGGPLALVGPVGTGAAWLARHLHDLSPQRTGFYLPIDGVPIPHLDGAQGGTVFIDTDQVRRLPPRVLDALFAQPPRLRPILAASSPKALRARLGEIAREVPIIDLAPLPARRGDVLPILQWLWTHELGSPRRIDDLGVPSLAAISAFRWPGNLDELRAYAPRLLAIAEHPSLRAAAVALGVTHQSLSSCLRRIGLSSARARDD